MIEISLKVRVVSMTGARGKAQKRIRCVVDTGATFTTLPARILERAGVQRKGPIRITLADGRTITRYFGHAVLQIEDGEEQVSEVATNVLFGEGKDPSLLGEVALETAGYVVDTVKGLVKKQYFTQF